MIEDLLPREEKEKEQVVAEVVHHIARAKHGDKAVPDVVRKPVRQEQEAIEWCSWHRNTDAKVVVFSYLRDFRALWGLTTNTGGLQGLSEALLHQHRSDPLSIVVVWDGIPQGDVGPVDTARYLNPIDWSIGLSLAIEQERQGHNVPYPAIRILILDLASNYVAYADSVQFAGLFPKRDMTTISWVRLFRPDSTGDRDWVATEFVANLLGNGQRLSSMREATQDRPHDLSSIRRLWRGNLVQPTKAEDRHSITNLVGVQVLLEGMGVSATVRDTHTAALVESMRAVGLVPRASDKAPGPWFPPERWKGLAESFVLLDDMADKGWTDFLRAALGLTNGYADRLHAFIDPIEAIRANAISLSPNEARRDLLFLDLRLFALTGREKERDFFKEVLDAYSYFISLPRKRESWQYIDEAEIAAINRYIEEQEAQETENYYAALTLFPRLIALANPWMSIILFSSTGQRHIIDRLQRYKNIIVEFDKPRFFSQATDTVLAETKRRFVRAMERALAIARGRHVCNEILKRPTTDEGHKPKPGSHVEFYLDESGSSPDIEVGGIAVIYPDKYTCLNFWQTLRDQGLVWGYHRDDPWSAPQGQCLPKASDIPHRRRQTQIGDTLRKIETLALDKGIAIAACCLGPLKAPPGNLPETVAPDFYFRSLLRLLLEILLCDWLPEYAPESTVTAYAGTRIIHDSDSSFKHDPAQFLRLQQDFNIGMRLVDDRTNPAQATRHFDVVTNQDVQNNWNTAWDRVAFLNDQRIIQIRDRLSTSNHRVRAYLFSFDDLYPIVLEVLGMRSAAPRSDVSALGVQLVYLKQMLPPHQLPRQLHYVADYVISCTNLVPIRWWERGFQDEAAPQLINLANASRHTDDPKKLVDAIVEWEHSNPGNHDTGSCARFIRERLRKAVANMKAEQFIQLCDKLALQT